MKGLAVDESLSEETRESAQRALDELVSAQIEQKKREAERNTALEELESESQFEAKKLEAEAESKRKKTDAKKMLQAAQVVSDDMMDWLGQHRLQQCAADLAKIAGAYAHSPSSLNCFVSSDCWVLCLQDGAAKRPAVSDRRGRRRD